MHVAILDTWADSVGTSEKVSASVG